MTVIVVIMILSGFLLPTLASAKGKAHTAICSSNMRNWIDATQMYMADFDDKLPLFGEDSMDRYQPFWHGKLAPYLAKKQVEGEHFTKNEAFTNAVRRCPAGRNGPARLSRQQNFTDWNCWIGAVFSYSSKPLTAPFYYGNAGAPLRASAIRRPDDAMLYMDTMTHFVYTPVERRYQFMLDMDGDGAPDSMASTTDVPFNYGRPTVHNEGANVTLLDGHVERVSYRNLWRVDSYGQATHSFWRIDD